MFVIMEQEMNNFDTRKEAANIELGLAFWWIASEQVIIYKRFYSVLRRCPFFFCILLCYNSLLLLGLFHSLLFLFHLPTFF